MRNDSPQDPGAELSAEQLNEPEQASNQTAFAEDVAVVSIPGAAVKPEASMTAAAVTPHPWIWLGIGGISLVAIFIGILGVWQFSQPVVQPAQSSSSPSPSPKASVLDPLLQQQLDELGTAINTIDPTTQRFVFPPVDLGLELESTKR